MQRSASGGTHYIFKSPKDAEYPGKLGRALDVKYKGYILLAPSKFEKGTYSWINDITPADAPDWLLTAKSDRQKRVEPRASVQNKVFGTRTGVDVSQLKADASHGISWHDNVLRLVGHMIAKGATDSEVHATTDALTLNGYTISQTRSEVQVMIDGGRRNGYGNAVSRARRVSEASTEGLQLDRSGRPACNHTNLVKLLTEHSDWQNVFVTDTFEDVRKVLKPLPYEPVPNSQFKPRLLTDNDFTQVCIWLNDFGIITAQKPTAIDAVYAACAQQSFNPLVDYLNHVQKRYPENDSLLDTWMTQFMGVKTEGNDEQAYVTAVSRLSLVQAIARAKKPGCKADSVVIFEGEQGTGKSTALRILFSDEYFGDQLPHMASKDASSYLKGKWGVELAELEFKKKTEVETIKAFISRQSDNYRPAYGRQEIVSARTCVFIGTTNRDDYLVDETGNRRFLPVKTGAINQAALSDHRDRLWAAAAHAYDANEQYWLVSEVAIIAQDQAKQRLEQDPWVETIGQRMAAVTEASIRDAFEKCFPDVDEHSISTGMNRRMSRCLLLAGWVKDGKFNSGSRRNQVKFTNPSPSEKLPIADSQF
jgi:predicted P-loop ATPase